MTLNLQKSYLWKEFSIQQKVIGDVGQHMETIIVKPNSEVLKKYVQYFLFLSKTDHALVNYTTFPNSNLCLAIYRQNNISYTNKTDVNQCVITSGKKEFISRYYGFHAIPFNVDIRSSLDQVCIVFHPSALRAFTGQNFGELLDTDQAFEQLFNTNNSYLLEQLFDEPDARARANRLEMLLLTRLQRDVPAKLQEALCHISTRASDNEMNIESLCKQLGISDSTLFRLFKTHLGQNPQKYLKTIRFRNVLSGVLNQRKSLTAIGYEHNYYDQPHFIKDFKTFAGQTPKRLLKEISLQKDLAWIYKENPRE